MSSTQLLLVEDEPLIASSVQDAFELAGYVVHVAYSGDEALAILEIAEPFDGLVTDIRCGPWPDGWAVAQRAREFSPNLPVIYMTGDSGHEHGVYGVSASVLVQKPFHLKQLVILMGRLSIDSAGPSD